VPLYQQFTDSRVLTSREQYLLYILEFELVNRLNTDSFRKAKFKIALLPYCLKETQADCKASPDEIDFRCMGCLKTCYINRVSKVLRENNIHPYILSQGRVSSLLKELYSRHGSLGVLGIACVVELVWGMRLCRKARIPVVGIPLNANRCIRWMDEFRETSVDLAAIENLVSNEYPQKGSGFH
jgi:hypothetical protein